MLKTNSIGTTCGITLMKKSLRDYNKQFLKKHQCKLIKSSCKGIISIFKRVEKYERLNLLGCIFFNKNVKLNIKQIVNCPNITLVNIKMSTTVYVN